MMTPARASFRRTLLILLAVVVVVRLSIAWVSWRNLSGLDAAAARVERGQRVLEALESVRSSLESAEADELAYLVGGAAADLSRFSESDRAARRFLAHAWTLAADDSDLDPQLRALAGLVDRRFQLSGAAAAARSRGFDAVRARLVADLGRTATAQALAAVDAARTREQQIVEARQRAQRSRTSRALGAIAAAAVVSIAAAVLVAGWLLSVFDDRDAERHAPRHDLRPAAR